MWQKLVIDRQWAGVKKKASLYYNQSIKLVGIWTQHKNKNKTDTSADYSYYRAGGREEKKSLYIVLM